MVTFKTNFKKVGEVDIRKILKKIEQTETPKVNKVAVAYSGGLNSPLGIEFPRTKKKRIRGLLGPRGKQSQFRLSGLPHLRLHGKTDRRKESGRSSPS